MKQLLVSATICCVLLFTAVAQERGDEPTLAETLEWIRQTCSVHAERHSISFDDCTVTGFWQVAYFSPARGFATFALKDVDSVTLVSNETLVIRFHLHQKVPAHFGRIGGATHPEDEFGLTVDNKETAERLKKALAHVLTLCRKQKEPF